VRVQYRREVAREMAWDGGSKREGTGGRQREGTAWEGGSKGAQYGIEAARDSMGRGSERDGVGGDNKRDSAGGRWQERQHRRW